MTEEKVECGKCDECGIETCYFYFEGVDPDENSFHVLLCEKCYLKVPGTTELE